VARSRHQALSPCPRYQLLCSEAPIHHQTASGGADAVVLSPSLHLRLLRGPRLCSGDTAAFCIAAPSPRVPVWAPAVGPGSSSLPPLHDPGSPSRGHGPKAERLAARRGSLQLLQALRQLRNHVNSRTGTKKTDSEGKTSCPPATEDKQCWQTAAAR